MIHDVIPSRDIAYSFYVKCYCGKELLHFAYFPEAIDCDEIIYVKYYGPDSATSSDSDIVSFSHIGLRKLSDHLKLSLTEKTYEYIIEDKHSAFIVTKDALGFYIIKKKNYLLAHGDSWEICLRDFNIKQLIIELDNMYNKIAEIREQNRINYINRIENEKRKIQEKQKNKRFLP